MVCKNLPAVFSAKNSPRVTLRQDRPNNPVPIVPVMLVLSSPELCYVLQKESTLTFDISIRGVVSLILSRPLDDFHRRLSPVGLRRGYSIRRGIGLEADYLTSENLSMDHCVWWSYSLVVSCISQDDIVIITNYQKYLKVISYA